MRTPCLLSVFILATSVASAARGDTFDRYRSSLLAQVPESESARRLDALTPAESHRVPPLDARTDGTFVVVQTGEGNWAKALVAWGGRRQGDEIVPVLVVERFVTYEAGRQDTALSAGESRFLFDGFEFDLDLGQVVPAGQGGDLAFRADGTTGALVPLEGAELYVLDASLLPEASPRGDPRDHEGVLPTDFTGAYRVNADGRWLGTLMLEVDEQGAATGTYTSADTSNTYEVTGRVSGLRHRLIFEVEMPAATQQFEAYLWTTDKSMMAGVTTMAGHQFGFVAQRVEDDAEGESSAR